MTGCDSETLSRYIDGELSMHEARHVRAHLETCPTCSRTYEALQQLDTLCRDVLPKTEFRRPSLPRRRHYRLAAAAAAVALLVAGGFTYGALRETFFAPETASSSDAQQAAVVKPAPDAPVAPDPATAAAPVPAAPDTPQPAAPAPAADESGRVFRGKIVNADGEPVAGANVSATGTDATSTTTSASGEFELPWPDGVTGFRVNGPGYWTHRVNVDNPPHDAVVTLRMPLFIAEPATGRVVDTAGRPLEGVLVRSQDSSASTRTGTDGSFTLRTQYGVILSYPGLPETTYRIDIPSSSYALSPGGAVRVRALKDGAPAPGVTVRLQTDHSEERAVAADSDGVALFEDVPPGQLAMRPPDGIDYSTTGDVAVQAGKTSECVINILEPRAGTARGKVFDADGAPIPNATVRVYSVDNPATVRTVATGADGVYEAALWPGRNEVRLDWWGLRNRYPGCRAADPAMMSVMPDASRTAYVEFRLERGQLGRVALQNERGEPLPAAVVEWENGFACSPAGSLWVAAANGEFDAPTGVDTIRAYDPEAERLGAAEVQPGQVARLRCDKPAAHVHGRIVDNKGNPVPYALVQAFLRDTDKPWAPSRCVTQTDRDGRYTLGPLAADASYLFIPNCRGYDWPENQRQNPVAVSAGMPDFNITLQRLDAVLEGRVVNRDGSLASDVRLEVENSTYRFDASLPTGVFSLDLLPGEYRLMARTGSSGRPEAESAPVTVKAPAKGIVLQLAEQGADQTPQGPEYETAENNLKQMGIVFKMFGGEHKGIYPNLSATPGVFAPDLSILYPEYLTDAAIVQWIAGRQNAKVVYLGYALASTDAGMAFLDAYQQYGPEGIADQDIALPEGTQAGGLDHLYRIREGIERFFITDINDPAGAARAQSTIPLMWEMPGAHPESGGFVLFMDGHTEWREYPGDYPMVPEFIDRINALSKK